MNATTDKKERINQILDVMPETFLDTLLKYLEGLKEDAEEEELLMQHFEEILEKDYKLFKRLAQ